MVKKEEGIQDYMKTYLFIKGYAMGKGYKNTLLALTLAKRFHDGQFRKGGDPYIVHPLRLCSQLISLGVDDDIILPIALLHDVIEDCNLPYKGKELVTEYGLPQEILDGTLLLTKEEGVAEKVYYEKLSKNFRSLLVKLSDRCNNVSTMQPFTREKKQKYLIETKEFVEPLCKYGKAYYPEYSNAITVMKYHIKSICETVQAFLDEENSSK